MDTQAREIASRRLRLAIDMFSTGVSLMREKLRRDFPQANECEIQERIVAWLRERPDPGVGLGRIVPWPRPPR